MIFTVTINLYIIFGVIFGLIGVYLTLGLIYGLYFVSRSQGNLYYITRRSSKFVFVRTLFLFMIHWLWML